MNGLAAFRNIHAGRRVIVCGCGESLRRLRHAERVITIGVNDVDRMMRPDYLVVVDTPDRLGPDRLATIQGTAASHVFTAQERLPLAGVKLVRFRLGEPGNNRSGDNGNDTLAHSVARAMTPHTAACLAVHMGATEIGLIGVDLQERNFLGLAGPHEWAPHLDTVDAHFGQLARDVWGCGVRLFNLSETSRLSALPLMPLEAFIARGSAAALGDGQRLRIVSYATTPLVGVPAILARCINARTPHTARAMWRVGHYDTGIAMEGDIGWAASPALAEAELAAADVVVVHNGKVDDRHRAAIDGKPVVTLAHNYFSNVDDTYVRRGFPGLVVGQYQATLPEFADWTAVPNPVPLWEDAYQPGAKPNEVTIAYTPSGRYNRAVPNHPAFWHAKGFDETLLALGRLRARTGVRLETTGQAFVPHAEALAMKRRAHIVIDECATGSYHRNSLEGLAAGCVVVNGIGLLAGVVDQLRQCAGGPVAIPFHGTGLDGMEAVLEELVSRGPATLAALGSINRRWMEQFWSFDTQWQRFWHPALAAAQSVSPNHRP